MNAPKSRIELTVPCDGGADLQPLPGRLGEPRGFLLEERAPRHDDVPAVAFDLGDAEAQALADVLGGIAAPEVDLRRRTERALPDHLHLEPALVLPRDHALDRDAVRRALAAARPARGPRVRASS